MRITLIPFMILEVIISYEESAKCANSYIKCHTPIVKLLYVISRKVGPFKTIKGLNCHFRYR